MLFKNSILLITTLLLSSACTTSHITLDTKKDIISISLNDNKLLEVTGQALYQDNIDLIHIKTYQYVYDVNSHIITYEESVAKNGYFFQYSLSKIVNIIFNDFYSKKIKSIGNIDLYVLKSKIYKEKTLYLLTENINKKKIVFLYGMNKASFHQIITALDSNKVLNFHSKTTKSTYNINTKTYKDFIQSNWNHKNIILDTLVAKRAFKPHK